MFVCIDSYMLYAWQPCSRKRQGDSFVLVRAGGTVSFFINKDRISSIVVDTADSLCANVLYVTCCACYVLTKHSLTRCEFIPFRYQFWN